MVFYCLCVCVSVCFFYKKMEKMVEVEVVMVECLWGGHDEEGRKDEYDEEKYLQAVKC